MEKVSAAEKKEAARLDGTKVEYRKRAKGGYYAYVRSEALDRTLCVIVTNHPYATGKVGNAGYWVAAIGAEEKAMQHTRKAAVARAVELLEEAAK